MSPPPVVHDSDFSDVTLPEIPPVPGMISESEARYLYWLTSTRFTGSGAVVEVGTWLGRSTLHLASGLLAAGHDGALHCFDRFIWSSDHARKASLPLRRGDDFQPWFERNVRPVYPNVYVTKAAVEDLRWDGGPIEILFLDAPKKLPAFSATLAALGEFLVPDRSILVMQDFLHPASYALPAVMSQLTDELSPLHVVRGGTTVSFAVRRPLRFAGAQPARWNFARWSAPEVLAAFERLSAALPAGARARLIMALGLLLYDRREGRAARAAVRALGGEAAVRAQWELDARGPLYEICRPLFKGLGIPPPPPTGSRISRIRQALRRGRAHGRRLLKQPSRST